MPEQPRRRVAEPESFRTPATVIGPIVLGTLLNALNSSMIAVALLSIQRSFHAGSEVIWLVSGLYLTTAVAQPMMGRLADGLGARRVFCFGLVVVVLAAAMAPLSPGLYWLVAARVLLGIGVSAAYPAGMAIIRDWLRGQQAAGATPTGGLAAVSAASQVAVALGPPLGGLLTEIAGWQAIFWVNVPFALTAFGMALRWLPPDERVPRDRVRQSLRSLDVTGMAMFVIALCALLLFLLSLGDRPMWPAVLVTVAAGFALVKRESRARTPFIDLRMLAVNRPLVATYLRCAITYLIFYAMTYALPLWLQGSHGLTPAKSGLLMLPVAAFGFVTTLCASRLSRQRGLRCVLVTGSAALTTATLALCLLNGDMPLWSLAIVAAVLGIPNGFNNLGNQALLYQTAPSEQIGVASGLYRTGQYVGANLASALVGLTVGHAATDDGLHALAAIVSVLGLGLLINAATTRQLS